MKGFPIARNRRRYEDTKFGYNKEPNYKNELFEFPSDTAARIFDRLSFLYGDYVARNTYKEILRIAKVHSAHKTDEIRKEEECLKFFKRFTQEDVILITYGDLIKSSNESPLVALSKFCGMHLNKTINTLHILPFYPSSSDRGFAVMDYESVDPKIGSWDDIEDLQTRYKLMFDGVINHVSSKSKWFLEFLNGNSDYEDFFTYFNNPNELSQEDKSLIFRPNSSEILSEYETIYGKKYLWTTFSSDQIDLNYNNPKVLQSILEIILFYIRKGADIVKLDAVTYLWAKPGTSCIHLEETHQVIKLFRDIISAVAPKVAIATETNVPHNDNISYFGNGYDESHIIYNFPLPPLVLFSFYSEDTTKLLKWIDELYYPSDDATYLNFLDSHNGISLMGVRDILSENEIDQLVNRSITTHGAEISCKPKREGGERVYEINTTWYSALNGNKKEDIDTQIKRFVASRSISLALKGVAGIYIHSLFGTENDHKLIEMFNGKKDLNRKILSIDSIMNALKDSTSKISKISSLQNNLIKIRTKHRAFCPSSSQVVNFIDKRIFSITRSTKDNKEHIVAITNISNQKLSIEIAQDLLPTKDHVWEDLISNDRFISHNNKLILEFEPYDIYWLIPVNEIMSDL